MDAVERQRRREEQAAEAAARTNKAVKDLWKKVDFLERNIEPPGGVRTASVTTSSLANNAEWQGTIQLAQGFMLRHLATSAPARVRVYASDAYRDADAARPFGVPVNVTADHGLIYEAYTLSGQLSEAITPSVVGGNLDGNGAVAISIQNRSGSTQEIGVEFSWQ